MAAKRVHGDDTTVPVLAKSGTSIGRVWTYVRDDRPFGSPEPPAAVFSTRAIEAVRGSHEILKYMDEQHVEQPGEVEESPEAAPAMDQYKP